MKLRANNVNQLGDGVYDVFILGGGINGAVSAVSLAAQGAKVALIDRGDFAGVSSSNSSNLAWGGVKYLESYELFLVNKLSKSRNHLMRNYPSVVQEIRFLTTIQKGFRLPVFFVFLGTILYWILGRFVDSPANQEVTEEDRQFVLDNVNAVLDLPQPLTRKDIISERCGVRPLAIEGRGGVVDWAKLSRKHAIDINVNDQHLSIFGGKLTDCLNVGEENAGSSAIWESRCRSAVKNGTASQIKVSKMSTCAKPKPWAWMT